MEIRQSFEVPDDFDPELMKMIVAARLDPAHPFWQDTDVLIGKAGVPQVVVAVSEQRA